MFFYLFFSTVNQAFIGCYAHMLSKWSLLWSPGTEVALFHIDGLGRVDLDK
jgi:hypothetical protein